MTFLISRERFPQPWNELPLKLSSNLSKQLRQIFNTRSQTRKRAPWRVEKVNQFFRTAIIKAQRTPYFCTSLNYTGCAKADSSHCRPKGSRFKKTILGVKLFYYQKTLSFHTDNEQNIRKNRGTQENLKSGENHGARVKDHFATRIKI